MPFSNVPTISLGELRAKLDGYADDFRISFSGLEFSRVKQRGPELLQIEFTQSVYPLPDGTVVVESHQKD